MRISSRRLAVPICACIALLALVGPAFAQTDMVNLVDRLKTYRFGGDKTLFDNVAQAVTESRTDPTRRLQLAQGLATVLRSDAAFDAKQLACRQLAFIGSEEQLSALTPLLKDESLGHYALMALARISGPLVDELLIKELSTERGRIQLEIMDVLAERRVAAAVAPIAANLAATDSSVSAGAAAALGKLGDARSVAALRKAYGSASGEQKAPIAFALLASADRMRLGGDRVGAATVFEAVDRDALAPVIRAAALRGIGLTRGERALPFVLKALAEDGTPRQFAAVGVLRAMLGKQVTTAVCAQLPKLSYRGQSLALEALGDRGDPAASVAVTALSRSSDSAVRAAAIRALGSVGDDSAVEMLLRTAASGTKEEQESAAESLARIKGPAVDAKLLTAVRQGDPKLRVEAIKAVGLRRAAVGTALAEAAAGSDRTVSSAALRVLRDTAGPHQLPGMLDLLLAKPTGSRDEAIDAVSEIARRGTDENQRTGGLIAKYSMATKPADRADLLAILAQVGGPSALQALQKAESDSSPEVRSTALKLLAEWPTDAPMADLLRAYRSSQSPNEKAVSLRGYIRMISMNDQRTLDQALALYKEAAAGAAGPAEKRLVLSGLGKLGSLPAMEYARGFLTDEAVRPEAELAVVEIGRATAAAFRDKTREALEPIARDSANEATRTRAREILALMDKLGEYITAWEVSPAYQREGTDYSKLFDIAFPPEQPGRDGSVPWRLMPVGTSADQPWLLDLLALYGGEQKVAYLRTAIWANSARDLTLELGSDDGAKAWWNGLVVVANNVARAVAPGQERVKVQAKQGWNQLLLKVTQNNQGWGAVARVANPDGTTATGLRFSIPSSVK